MLLYSAAPGRRCRHPLTSRGAILTSPLPARRAEGPSGLPCRSLTLPSHGASIASSEALRTAHSVRISTKCMRRRVGVGLSNLEDEVIGHFVRHASFALSTVQLLIIPRQDRHVLLSFFF